jgi:hypothetical protein
MAKNHSIVLCDACHSITIKIRYDHGNYAVKGFGANGNTLASR